VDRIVPLYYQLATLLSEKIVSHALRTGDRLPTEIELVQEYGISRITVRQALRMLEEEGLIRREVGRGTFVSGHRPLTGALKIEGSFEDVSSLGRNPVKVLDVSTVKLGSDEAAMMGIDVGSQIVRARRTGFLHGEPYSHSIHDLPQDIGTRLTQTDWKGDILRIVAEKLKIHLRDADQTVCASLADARLARLLNTKVGAPLLVVERIVRTDHARVVERARIHYRSDMYTLRVRLKRNHPEADWSFAGKGKSR
jgi:GntR family transcriptional regulator